MTQILYGTAKTKRKENKKNDRSRPKEHMENSKNPPKFENWNGEPIE